MRLLGFRNEKQIFTYENSSIVLQVGGNHFFFKSKDIKEVFPSFFLLIMSRASGVLHIKVYGHFPLVCNYLIQFYRKRSNLGLFQKDSEQT